LCALGERKSFSDAALEDVAARLAEAETVESFVVIDAPRAFDHAVRMRALDGEGDAADREPPAGDED
jgi:hypothetical protein